MAYKKYIKRGGKTYGPYVYHSKRVDGKVVSEYIGPQKVKINYKKISLVVLGIFVFLMLVFFLSQLDGDIAGRAILDFDVDYLDLEEGLIEGSLNLSLQEEDFIPATSKLIFENGGNISEFYLADLVSESEIVEKTIYPAVYFNLIIEFEEQVSGVNETNVSSGDEENEEAEEDTEETENNVTINETIGGNESEEGIGNETSGKSESKEDDSIINETAETNGENENDIAESKTENEVAEEVIENEANVDKGNNGEDLTGDEMEGGVPEDEGTDDEDGEENEPTEENNVGAPLTGETIRTNKDTISSGENEMLVSKIVKIISNFLLSLRITGYATENPVVVPGDVSFNQDFVYDLEKGKMVNNVTIEPESVRTDSKNLSEEYIEVKIEDSKIIVAANYSETLEGFSGIDLVINMSDLNVIFVPGELKIKIIEPDSGKELFSFLATVREEGIEELTKNETGILFLPEVIELNESERNILIREFGENISVSVSEATEKNNLLVVRYRLAHYEMIRSYDLSLSKEVIESFMERDRIKLIKDIVRALSQEKESGEARDEFLREWPV